MDTGAWIALSAGLLTLAALFNGMRATRVNMYQDRISLLESDIKELKEQNRQCKAEVKNLREQQEYLFRRLNLHDDERRAAGNTSKWPEKD